ERMHQLDLFLAWVKRGDPVPPAMPHDPELSGIIARAMAHEPARRFTADELVRALKQYLTGDLVFSHRYSVTGRVARWAGRHGAVSALSACSLVFVSVGVLVWVQLERSVKEIAHLRALAADDMALAEKNAQVAAKAKGNADAAKPAAEQTVQKVCDEPERL